VKKLFGTLLGFIVGQQLDGVSGIEDTTLEIAGYSRSESLTLETGKRTKGLCTNTEFKDMIPLNPFGCYAYELGRGNTSCGTLKKQRAFRFRFKNRLC
jgi:hypothetical protein